MNRKLLSVAVVALAATLSIPLAQANRGYYRFPAIHAYSGGSIDR